MKRQKMPDNVYINGEIPPEMKRIAPDYDKWRRELLRVNAIIVAVVFLLEIVVSVILFKKGLVEIPLKNYLTYYMMIPTLLNLLAVLAEIVVMKKFPKNDRLQDMIIIITMTMICTVVASTHSMFKNTMTIFCIPILISVVFCFFKLTFTSMILSLAGLVVTVIFRYAVHGENTYLLPEIVISVSLIILSEILAQLINRLMFEQRMKLVGAIAEAKRSQHEAQVMNNAKSSFLANMSHEIRTPINAILGMNEMILREEKDPVIREYAGNIQTSGNSLLSIINDVLDISKIESGKTEIINSVYAVSSLVNDCYNMTAAKASQKGLEFIVECDDDLPRLLSGDEIHIRQIIVNLLTNAIKYTEKGSVRFQVSSEKTDDRFNLNISVKDTGIGISEEDMSKIFTRFSRFDIKRNKNIEGTGLGLVIVKHFTELMGGTVSVKSKLDEGSEFTVSVPQEVIDADPSGSINLNYLRSADYEYECSFEAPEAHILAVDDVAVNLMVITNMLKNTKVKIDTANNGKDAIKLTEKNRYDIILMDHMMPEMDGVETYSALRADERSLCRDTPVIMLTANAISGVRERYMNNGFSDYISKPVQGKTLEDMIKKYLPDELIHTADTSETVQEHSEQETENSSTEDDLLKFIPELNINTALAYCCGSMELFIDILKDYSSNKRYDEMTAAFNEERFDDYRREAHSLKSTSLTIGLAGLSERARAAEYGVKSGSMEFVKLNHDELMTMYEDVLKKIGEFLKIRGVK